MPARALVLLTLGVAALTGCGKSEAEKEREKAAGRGPITCEGTPLSGPTGLPASFPKLADVTFVKAEKRGPTQVVDGYAEAGLEELYDGIKSSFEGAGYTILFDEREEDDAEISYRVADGKSEGQVALRAACDDGRVSVHVTNRPS